MPTQIIMYVNPYDGKVYLNEPPGIVDPILIPYNITIPFTLNDIVKGINASGGLIDLGSNYVVKLIINIPQ